MPPVRRLSAVVPGRARAVLYLRQSVARDDSVSLELQETAGRDHCARHGYDVVAVIADPGVSGRTFRRAGVTRVMDMIEAGEADVIVLWKWSRLSRSRRDWAVAADRVDVAGGRIESATEPVDVTTSTGRLARGVLTEFAAFESERIGDTWKEVHARRRRLGLPHAGYARLGYQRHGSGYLPDPDTAPLVAELYERYLRGAGFRQLAEFAAARGLRSVRTSRPWTGRGLKHALDSGFAAGLLHLAGTGEYMPGAHPGIIDAATWDGYLRERTRRSNVPPRSLAPTTWLAGLVRCRGCATAMRAKTDVRYGRAYLYACETPGCPRPASVKRVRCELALLEWMTDISDDVTRAARAHETSAAAQRMATQQARLLARDVTRLDEALGRLVRSHGLGAPAEIVQREIAVLTAERTELLHQLGLAEAESGAATLNQGAVIALLEQWHHLPIAARREELRQLSVVVWVARRDRQRPTVVVGTGSRPPSSPPDARST